MNALSNETLFIILGVLVLLSGFFSGSETALVSLNRYRLRHLVKSGHRGAIIANWLLERPDRLIGLILIFNNFVNILASAIATVIGLRLFGEPGIAIATGVLTFVILIFSEVTPKTFATTHPERLAFPAAFILKPLLKLCFPLVALINFFSNNLLKLLGISKGSDNTSVSAEELRVIVTETGKLIPSKHRKMLLSILDLEAVTVEDIMIPRNEMIGLDLDDDWGEIQEQLTHSLHTVIPVYHGDINNITGMLHIKNALPILAGSNSQKDDLLRVIEEAYYIPEGTTLNRQLINFQSSKNRIGLVVDEYGDIQGMATVQDILEEIVGEFTTDPANSLTKEVHPQADGTYLVEGSVNIRELNRIMNWQLPTDGAKTLNGLILEYLESIPETSTSVLLNDYPIEIVQVKNNVVKTVKISPRLESSRTD